MARFKPGYLLHGHAHVWQRNTITQTVFQSTTVLNVFPARVVEIIPPEEAR